MKKILLVCLTALFSLATWAQNVAIPNDDGVTIYYTLYPSTLHAEITNGGSYGSYSGYVEVPETIEYEGDTYTVTQIYYSAFDTCPELTAVKLPETITFIDQYGFYGDSKLESVNTPNVTSTGTMVFYNCSSLKSISLESIQGTGLGEQCFSGCTGLEDVTLSESMTRIDTQTFYNCSSLKTITIPSSVTTINSGAFRGCTSLADVYSLNTTPPTLANNNIFQNIASDAVLHVPSGCVDEYEDSSWSSFFSTIVEIEEVTTGTITITSAGYATYYTDVEYVMPTGVKGTTVTGVTSDNADDGIDYVLTMNWEYIEGSVVPANTALVLQGKVGEYKYETSSTGATAPTDNLLMGSVEETTTYGPDEDATYIYYELSDGQNGVGFYYGVEGGGAFTSATNKAWLPLSESQVTNARFLGFGKGDDTTGISSIESASENTVSGIYTIQGVRVSNTNQPGLYIVDGKKVLVK